MKKAFVIILSVLLFISIFVSCDSDNIIDEMFGFVVTFNANGGTGTMEPQRFTTEGGKLNPNTFTKTDYVFSKWNTSADGTGTDYADGENIKSSSDITLYAQWKLASIVLTPDTTDWVDGKSYTIENDLTITERVTITGNVTLVLPDGKTLTSSSGITVGEGSTLSITTYGTEGTGKLIATGGGGSAAIGGMNESGKKNAGTIIIDGVNIEARGGEGGAGIGGAYQGSGGNITISGEDTLVTATAGSGLGVEGIGKGESGSASGTLTIGEGQGLYGGSDKDNMVFLSGPTESYAGVRTAYMEATATEFVTVSFNANGGSGTMAAQSVRSGIDTTLDANEFTHATLSFGGWALTSGGEAVYSDQGTINVSDDTTLYATWIDVIYLSSDMTTIEGGKKYSIEDNLTIPNRLSIDGSNAVTIILPKDKTLTLEKGINVESGKSLIIDGSGSLISTAEEGSGDAGIGGAKGSSGGSITIKGGIITANGASGSSIDGGGAGIGGGHNGSGGTVIISGGNVTANGGAGASMGGGGAGIGSGNNGNALGSVSGGTITISGGTVNATGGASDNNRYGAGLGGGNYSNGATVSITGGTVKATSGAGVGAIGAGCGSSSHGSLAIGAGLGLYGGADKDHADFLSAPTESYTGARPVYMETKATDYVTVTFNANGGSGTMAAQSVRLGVDTALNKNIFTHATLSFGGWALTSSGEAVYSDQGTINVSADTTLYATWIDIVYLTAEATTLEGGKKYSIDDNLTIPNRLSIDGSNAVTIILPKDKTLTLEKGISVTSGKSLIIDGKGTLTATGETNGSNGSAGIGGSLGGDLSCGTVTIKGGIVETTGGYRSAGIGGAYNMGWGGTGGSVTISGGTVTATGEENGGAGIGGGGGDDGHGGTVIISGGTVNATGISNSAGIGGGNYSNGGTVTITGGNVTATGGDDGAGIGGGSSGGKGGTVEISGELTIVTAKGGSGAAGIGGGAGQESHEKAGGDGGNVTISGGAVTATGGDHGAGIGGGEGNAGYPAGNGGIVTISGGTVSVTGGAYAAGIGGGGSYDDTNGGNGGTVTVTGGTIIATGKDKAAGIGGGGSNKYLGGGVGGTIVITGGTVQATGGSTNGIGIGGGRGSTTRSNDGSLKIGSDLGLYGGENQASSHFRSFPTESYVGARYAYMEARPTTYVTITYDGNGGTGEMTDQLMIKDEAEIALSANTFTTPNPDLVFSGWAESSTGNVVYSDEGNIAFSEDTTLYAIWGEKVIITESMKKLVAGAEHTLLGDVTNGNRLYISGGDSATITLTEGKTLNLSQGINVPQGKTLTINGNGTMNATGGTNQAGIGGGNKEYGGSIIINGGTITARGGGRAAGIGAGGASNGDYGYTAGELIVNGGNVTAYGGNDGGAGIGGGRGPSLTQPGAGGTVTINDGIVTAYGGSFAAGIGGGPATTGRTTIILTVNGGSVTATGNGGGAGIGGFKDYAGGIVTINGGTVTAAGSINVASDSGMGIGHGSSTGGGSTNNGKLTIGFAESQTNTLAINNGWSLYYGDTENPTAHVDGLHEADDIDTYAKRYMNVSEPVTP